MTNTRFQTKIIYIVIIAVLLVPLFVLGRPASIQKGDEGQVKLSGGYLADLRQQEDITDAQLGEIDPGSSTMKLATFGMRGVALVLLWNKSLEYEKKSDWNNVVVTSNQITMLEPRFTTVWDFLSWRMAYNGSRDQDDYRERYRWVIRGYDYLEDGIHYNLKAPFLYHKAGWMISQKIGIADEKVQFRQLFRQDDEFHKAAHIPYPSGTPSVDDRDNWLYGIPLYGRAEDIYAKEEASFLEKKAAGLLSDVQVKDFYDTDNKKRSIGGMARPLFYAHSRMNWIHYADYYEQDGSFGERARENWRTAQGVWERFGEKVIPTTIDDRKNPGDKRVISLNAAAETQAEIDKLNADLESLLAPRTKKDLYVERWNTLTELQQGTLVDALKNVDALKQGTLVDALKKPYPEQFEAICDYLDETRPNWKEELTALRNSLIEAPEELDAFLIPEPIRKGNRGMEQSDDRDEINMAQKASRALEEVTNQASSALVMNPAAIAGEIGRMVTQQRDAYNKQQAELAENPDLANEPDFIKLEPPSDEAVKNVQRARDIVQDLEDEGYRHQLPKMFCELTNYIHYGQQIEVEQTTEAVAANEAKFLARKAYNQDADVFEANRKYLESMRIWSELLENPRYEYLRNDLFRRDFLEFVEKYHVVTDKLDDAERGSLYPIDFPFANVVRLEFENGRIDPMRDSLDYLRQCYEKGEYDEVVDRSVLLINAWKGFMEGNEYLKYAPVPEYKDEVVEVFALYVDSLQKTGREFASDIVLLDFINDVMYYEPMTREALGKSKQVDQDQEGGEALLAKLESAALDWSLVVEQFPVLKLPPMETYVNPSNYERTEHLRNCYDEIAVLIARYVPLCENLKRPITTDFPLYEMLPPGVNAVDPATVTPSTVEAPVADPPAVDTSADEPQTDEVPTVESVAEPVQVEDVAEPDLQELLSDDEF